MILTLTPVPSLDRTATTGEQLGPDMVCQLGDISTVPGGVGVNVTHTLYRAGRDTLAVFPAPEISHYMRLMAVTGTPHQFVAVPGPIQMHFTLTDPAGATTVLKDPPMPLDPTQLAMLRDLAVTLAETASWVLLAGPLPNIATAAWYVEVIRALTLYHPKVRIAVATEGDALHALVRQLAVTHPHVLVVTQADLASVTGRNLQEVDDAALLAAADELVASGVPEVLVACSRSHAVLVNESEAWSATTPAPGGRQGIHWRESLLAGYLMAAEDDAPPAQRLASALAYAHAQGSQWDNFLPTPDLVQHDVVECTQLR
ncbi:1-phosphofructokinase family hexose kinase [Corynebacterium canis]|uniref:1-phosphofructokinase family hexose kinase n=1 Tax=Corynebacterium canis TaxID=679663 RepID=A0A5C5UM45_9CORY|nr:PfkB family carbohydrate kinase [Corynebacterium canis]TWT26887.1 1-phosphofructokinase family hexose kinase [Corynebacterium canis]WJY75511.1 Tagatose-6-phosphate kinase [Corynebacterium canis]